MADFRKLLFAFALVGLLLAAGTPVFAQANPNASPSMVCTASSGVPPFIRAEGITELVGDAVLVCQGGTPTGPGVLVPPSQISASLNTNVTSRLINAATSGSEALLLIDEPFAGNTQNSNLNNPQSAPVPSAPTQPATQVYCPVPATSCPAIVGLGVQGVGVLNQGQTGPYGNGKPNVFQGTQTVNNRVDWLGIPLDAPGTVGTRTLRITNVRANACQLGVSSTLTPTQIFMLITINGSQQVTLVNPQIVVGAVTQGLSSSVRTSGSVSTVPIFSQYPAEPDFSPGCDGRNRNQQRSVPRAGRLLLLIQVTWLCRPRFQRWSRGNFSGRNRNWSYWQHYSRCLPDPAPKRSWLPV